MEHYISLCSGYGGLDLAVERLTGATLVAYAEVEPAPARIMAAHWPGAPNLGDIATIEWDRWDVRADYIAAGFPCQNVSNAGDRTGLRGAKSGVWSHVVRAVEATRPRAVFLENVAAIRSRGLAEVAEDLAAVGYDLRWTCLRASDVGAAHRRDRWFGLARPAADAQGI